MGVLKNPECKCSYFTSEVHVSDRVRVWCGFLDHTVQPQDAKTAGEAESRGHIPDVQKAALNPHHRQCRTWIITAVFFILLNKRDISHLKQFCVYRFLNCTDFEQTSKNEERN